MEEMEKEEKGKVERKEGRKGGKRKEGREEGRLLISCCI